VGPSREGSPTHGLGGHSRNVSGNSRAPLLPPGVTSSSPTPPSSTLVNPSGPHTATPTRSGPLKDAVVRAGGTSSGDHEPQEPEDKLARTKNWIERSLAR